MSMSGPNPVLAPIRRWVLYSRTHLAITVAGTIAALFAIGAVVGEDPTTPRTTQEATSITAEGATDAADTVTYELDEVSESLVAAKPASWASSTAPATAMAYAHTFVDTIPSDAMWAAKIGRYTTAEPGTAFLAARPRTPVVITGPTASTLSAGPEGTRVAKVSVPTQAGSLQISLRVDSSTAGQRWVVDTPLPTLELTELNKIAVDADRSTAPTTTSTPAAVPTTTTTSPASTPPQPSFDLDEPAPELQESTASSSGAGPVPVPGPIPIPELDTPIPGER